MPQNVYLQLLGQKNPNAAQVIGGAARQLNTDLTESQKLKMAMQELVQRRQSALLANRMSEMQMKDAEDKKAEAEALRAAQQKGRDLIFKKRMDKHVSDAPEGYIPSAEELAALEPDAPSEAAPVAPPAAQAQPYTPPSGPQPYPSPQTPPGGVPPYVANPGPRPGMNIPDQRVQGNTMPAGYSGMEQNMDQSAGFDPTRMSREDELRIAAENQNIGMDDYFKNTDPTRDPQFVLDKLATQAGYNLTNARDRQEFQWKMAQFLEGGRNKRAAEMDKSKPKTASGMPLAKLGDTEVKKIGDIRNAAWNIATVKSLASDISSLKFGPINGAFSGRNPYDSAIQRLSNAIRATVPSLARGVYGEVGVLTDSDRETYEALLPKIKTDPTVAAWIVQDLQDKIAAAWSMNIRTMEDAGRDVSGFSPDMTFDELADTQRSGRGNRPPPPAPAGAPGDSTGAQDDLARIRARMAARKAGGAKK